MATKVTVLPYQNHRCIDCGRDLPRGRRRRCHICLPPRPWRKTEPKDPSPDYTLNDRVAQADAYGLSYGHFMAIIHTGGKLPPLRHPIRWPADSAHIGE